VVRGAVEALAGTDSDRAREVIGEFVVAETIRNERETKIRERE
jgi:hypothetical protein